MMAKGIKQTDEEKVAAFISGLDPVTAAIVNNIREIILSSSKFISEQIKWNHPAFHYTGEMPPFDPKEYKRDIAVFNIAKGRIMLVIVNGAGLKDPAILMEGDYKDGRRLIYFTDMKDVEAKEKGLNTIMKDWVKRVGNG